MAIELGIGRPLASGGKAVNNSGKEQRESPMDQASAAMLQALERQRAAFTAAMPEPLSARRDRIERAIALLVEHQAELAAAASADFGHRSTEQTLLTDILPSVSALKHARGHLKRWARGERRATLFPLGLIGGRSRIEYQPKGVIGIIAPWNFPIGMVMAPLAGVLAAGNRALIKPSEFTPRVSDLLADLIAQRFAPEEVAVFTGGVEVGTAFAALPFDHLVFTGATSVGKHVMRAAAENLVPVTLELGGKSPTIVSRSADLPRAAERIALGKMMNAGQICLAPDYLLVPREREGAVIDALREGVTRMYPTLLANDDYTSVINARHRARLEAHLADALAKGAEAIEVNPAGEDFAASNRNKLPLTILRNVDDGMTVMQEEIFGPILPVVPYDTIEAVIAYINARPRPLGLYWFGRDRAEERQVLSRTLSGGVTINDVVFHVTMDDLPFGGIGPSGMGHYHGIEGFRSFSHARSIYRQSPLDVAALAGLKPPYGKLTRITLQRELRK